MSSRRLLGAAALALAALGCGHYAPPVRPEPAAAAAASEPAATDEDDADAR